MNDFNKRTEKSKELTDYFVNFLNLNKISYYESGYEFYKDTHNATEKIKYLKDNTSEFIRYYPDFTIVGEHKSLLIEAKNSSGIEKKCYNNYLSLVQNLNINVLLLLKNKKLCRLEDLKFSIVNKYDKIAEMNIPVTDKVWKEPRKMNDYEYKLYKKKYKEQGKYTSGCSFAFIDFENTKFYDLKTLLHLKN